MTPRLATNLIRAAGYGADLCLARDPECEDDEIAINGSNNISVQISASRNGLYFCASVTSGVGEDWGVTHGKLTRDPVEAARDALRIGEKLGLPTEQTAAA